MTDDSNSDDIYTPEKAVGKVPAAPQVVEDTGGAADEREREAAFAGGPLMWQGQELRPWTSAREGHWIELRHAMGSRHLSECILSSYTFLPDAFRILFLSLAPQRQLEELRGDPVACQRAVDRWVDEHVPLDQHDEANRVAMALYNRAHANRAESAPAESPMSGDELGN